MQVCDNVKSNMKRFYVRLQSLAGIRKRKQPRRMLEISAPFDFKKEETVFPGLSEDEICVLREKAAASRIGVAAHECENTNPYILSTPPRSPKYPRAPVIPARTSSKSPGSPASPASAVDLNLPGPGLPNSPVSMTKMI